MYTRSESAAAGYGGASDDEGGARDAWGAVQAADEDEDGSLLSAPRKVPNTGISYARSSKQVCSEPPEAQCNCLSKNLLQNAPVESAEWEGTAAVMSGGRAAVKGGPVAAPPAAGQGAKRIAGGACTCDTELSGAASGHHCDYIAA